MSYLKVPFISERKWEIHFLVGAGDPLVELLFGQNCPGNPSKFVGQGDNADTRLLPNF